MSSFISCAHYRYPVFSPSNANFVLVWFCHYMYISSANTMPTFWFPVMTQALWFPLLEAMMAPQKLSSSAAAPHLHCEGKPVGTTGPRHLPHQHTFCLQNLLWQWRPQSYSPVVSQWGPVVSILPCAFLYVWYLDNLSRKCIVSAADQQSVLRYQTGLG